MPLHFQFILVKNMFSKTTIKLFCFSLITIKLLNFKINDILKSCF